MSGIYGVVLLSGNFRNALNKERIVALLKSLAVSNQVRGNDASGLAVVGTDKIQVLKEGIEAKKFIETAAYNKFLEDVQLTGTYSFIGHCRSAGLGTSKNNKNNSPLIVGDIVGAHDGDIRNYASLFECYEKYFNREAEVSSEIVFKLFNHFYLKHKQPFSDTIKRIDEITSGTSAYALASSRIPSGVCLVRGKGNPLEVKLFEDEGLIVFSSSGFHIDEAAKSASMDSGKKVPLTLCKGLLVCAKKNEYVEIDLN
jgi:glucosamine 6-phosphate synthetase-like amidotransferase/phosphosugar isomerase protein